MQRKKSRFWSFIWSLVPGAGEMYLGFMKMGVSLMLGFMLLIAIAAITNIGALSVFPIAMWFYSFFHANNLAGLDDQAFFEVKDRFLFGLEEWNSIEKLGSKMNEKKKKGVAAVFIVIGVLMLWQAAFSLLCDIFGWDNVILREIYFFMRDDLPRFVVGFAIIWAGMVMIRGKKEDITLSQQSESYIEQDNQPSHFESDIQSNNYDGQN
ncbi:MAG: hypothetical protein K2L82_07790 [Lachnospiraceae bacterium]|nr:hypothetical protein [Lachnospiraceae bacterium]